ncbi:MAG: sugar ABC transporter permease [Lachnospiraceae bacterium]|nr:sugar ABC transporter permease [Ruminococcus sp.]MCM1274760.1 sugar ABC transporter permease [Lachnospiraceae bacterium]
MGFPAKNTPAKKENFLSSVGKFFKDFGTAVAKGDFFVKLSLIWFGAGYIRRKQFVRTLLITVFEAAVILYTIFVAPQYISKFGTLGTVQMEQVFDINTMQYQFNDYDDSFQILLFSVISIVIWVVFIFAWMKNVIAVYELQLKAESGKHINSFKDDINDYLNEKFHVTLLTLPVLGIVLFSIVPIFVLILVAFTNYDQQHMPPSALFTWTGLTNFINLFGGGGLTITFGYSFGKILIWTIIWALFATFTTFFGGILLALFLRNKRTRLPKLWRSLFVVTIAVPQFVTLLLVRNFFANNGIANTILRDIGVTGFLKTLGLVSGDSIPFLSAPGWAHVMIILINIWIGVPYQMLIMTGVLSNLPEDQIESASIDGATKFQVFRHITMPYVLFVTGPSLVTDFVKNINNFNVIYLLTQDVYTTTDQALANSQAKEVDLLVTWLFRLTQEYYNYKMASVIGICVFVICSVITLVAFGFMTKGDKEGVYN